MHVSAFSWLRGDTSLKSVDVSFVTAFSFFVATIILPHSIQFTKSEINSNNSAFFLFTLRKFRQSFGIGFFATYFYPSSKSPCFSSSRFNAMIFVNIKCNICTLHFLQYCWKVCDVFGEIICTAAAPSKIIVSNSGTLC